jgi:hypothetical protein
MEKGRVSSAQMGGTAANTYRPFAVANFIAYNLNLDVSAREFKKAADSFFKKIEKELGWMYETVHTAGRRKGRINYVVWSEVFICPNCAGDVVFMDQAYDSKTGKFAGEFECPVCRAALTTVAASINSRATLIRHR